MAKIMVENEAQQVLIARLADIADVKSREQAITQAAMDLKGNFAQDSKHLSDAVNAHLAQQQVAIAPINSHAAKVLDGRKDAAEMQIKNMITLLQSGELNTEQAMKVSAQVSEVFAKNHAAELGVEPKPLKETLQAGFENLIVERYHMNSLSAGMTASKTGEKSYSLSGQHTFKLDDALTTTPYLSIVLSKGGGNIAMGVQNSHGAYDTVIGRVIPLSGGGVGFDPTTHKMSANGYVGLAATQNNDYKTTQVLTGSINNQGNVGVSLTEAATLHRDGKNQLDIYLNQGVNISKDGEKAASFGGGLMGKSGCLQGTLGGAVNNVGGTGSVDPTVNLQVTYQTDCER